MGLNCTVMELKRRRIGYVYFCCMCLNCTVMELKPVGSQRVMSDFVVLIVPLWN